MRSFAQCNECQCAYVFFLCVTNLSVRLFRIFIPRLTFFEAGRVHYMFLVTTGFNVKLGDLAYLASLTVTAIFTLRFFFIVL